MKRKTRISKSIPAKAEPEDKVYRLDDIDPEFVSLVRAGANRQKAFMVIKEDEQGLGPGGTCVCPSCGYEEDHATGEKCNEQKCPKCGATMTRKEDDAEKAVPAADATPEDKRKAQDARATQYGIEAREDGNLSYTAGDPTTESLYGDPVNLMYLFGKDDNKADVGRIRNALARFSANRDEYSETTSKVKVLTRIVEAALAAGVAVTMPENDPIYDALPAALRERIEGTESSNKGDGDDADGTGNTDQDATDLSSWLNEAGEKVADLSLDHAIQQALDAQADDTPAAKEDHPNEAAEIEPTAPPPVEKDGEEAQKEDEKDRRIAKLEAELKKARVEMTAMKAKLARLSKGIGKSSVMLTGEVTAKEQQLSDSEKTSPSRGAFLSGGDIAAAVEKD